MKNEIIIAMTLGVYNTYTIGFEKEILYQSKNFCNTSFFYGIR